MRNSLLRDISRHEESKMTIKLAGKQACLHVWKVVVPGFFVACLLATSVLPGLAAEPPARQSLTAAEILAAAKPQDWRSLDPENTLYLELASGRVVIELAPAFAPNHVANVKALAREKYFDGLAIVRVQDNYVVQWGDPGAEKPETARKILKARKTLPAEFDRAGDGTVQFTALPDGDVYASEVGFSGGFPVARDREGGRMWLIHCYGMVGAGRGDTADSGGGAEDYVVIGHAPRHLDRNCTLFGRVVQGIERLSSLPRAGGPMGFIEDPAQLIPIRSLRVAADVPPQERSELEVLRTDTETFRRLIEARRARSEEWFLTKPGRVEVCNVPVPVRKKVTPVSH
jgi:peptidylprolyl isomerase